jgi:hypothetical protein
VLKKENFESNVQTSADQELLPTPPQTPVQEPSIPERHVHFEDPKQVRFDDDSNQMIRFDAMTPEPIQDDRPEIENLLQTGSREDENVASVLQALEQGKNRHPFLQLAQCQQKNGLLYYREKIYVPDYEDTRTRVIR